MQNAFRFLVGLALAAPLFVFAQTPKDIGVVNVQGDTNTIPITISSASPELQNLALTAFKAHGRFSLVASRAAFFPAGASRYGASWSRRARPRDALRMIW